MRRSLLVLALLLAVTACVEQESPPPAVGRDVAGWTRLPDAPLSGRIGATVVALDDRRVLVVGGWEWLCPPTADCNEPDEPKLADGAVVDLGTGEWRQVADAPFGFFHGQAVTVGESVFILADPDAEHGGPLELLRYDVATDRWERRARPGTPCVGLVPLPRGLVALCESDENGEHPDRLYDAATDTWEDLPDDPLPAVYDRSGVRDGDRLVVFGSVIDGGDEQGKVVAALDLATRRWTRLPDAPGQGYQAWAAGDEVWLNPHFSSRAGGGVLDLATDTWRPLPDLPPDDERPGDLTGIIAPGAATYEYAEGWVRDARTDGWVDVPPRAGTTYDETVTAAGEALVVFGGQDWGDGQGAGELVAELWVWRPPVA